MKEIIVKAGNRVGALAEVAEMLGGYGVNIGAISAYGSGNTAIFRIVTEDSTTAMKHLSKIPGLKVEESDIIVVDMPNKPGELGKITRKLANKNIDMEALYLVNASGDNTKVALKPAKDSFEKAKESLGIRK